MVDWDLRSNGVVDSDFLAEHLEELAGATQLDIAPACFYGQPELEAVLVPSLEALRFSRFEVGPDAGGVGKRHRATTNAALGLFTKLQKLRRLSLPWSYLIDDSGANSLSMLHQLDEFTLESDITDHGLSRLATLYGLRVLDLTCSFHLTGEGFKTWPELPRLRALVLSQCGNIGDVALGVLTKAPELDFLVLSGCTKLTNGGLAAMRGGPKLKSIMLYGLVLDLQTIRSLRENNPIAEIDCDVDHLPDVERNEAQALMAAPRRRL